MTDPLRTYLDYVSGQLEDHEAEAFEELQFDAAARGELGAIEFVAELERLVPFVGRYGPIATSVTASHVAQLVAQGVRVAEVNLHPRMTNSVIPWDVNVNLVVTHLNIDVRGADLVDVIMETVDGQPAKLFHDVHYDPADGSIYALCEEPVARAVYVTAPTRTTVIVERSGKREEVAQFLTVPGTLT